MPDIAATPIAYLTERQVAERLSLHPDSLNRWRHKQRGGPYWVDLANPGRNRDTSHLPVPRRPIIRYPEDRLEQWMRGETA